MIAIYLEIIVTYLKPIISLKIIIVRRRENLKISEKRY